MNRQPIFIALAVAAALIFAGFYFLYRSSLTTLTIVTPNENHEFVVEVADSTDLRAKGLMFRTELAPNAGMVFDFHEERPVSFWMKNTYIPLDMIFIDAEGTIVNIHENARPHDETSITSGEPVRFVLEIPGGRSRELNIQIGQKIVYQALE